jgi:hypothetical protein
VFVLANGAYKSGSTWLLAILCELKKFYEIPEPYRKRVHKQVWVDPVKLRAFLESGCYRERDYISKGHYSSKKTRDLLLSHDDVTVFDITRDLRDTIVSHYYHFSRMYGVDWDFDKYYWRVGRYKAFEIRQYHQTWGISAPNVYVASFERLKRDFGGEVRQIARVLGMELDQAAVERVKEETSLSAMRNQRRKAGATKFFRKGEVGDWAAHFDERTLADVQRIEKHGLPLVERGIYALLFDVRNSVRFKARSLARTGARSAA